MFYSTGIPGLMITTFFFLGKAKLIYIFNEWYELICNLTCMYSFVLLLGQMCDAAIVLDSAKLWERTWEANPIDLLDCDSLPLRAWHLDAGKQADVCRCDHVQYVRFGFENNHELLSHAAEFYQYLRWFLPTSSAGIEYSLTYRPCTLPRVPGISTRSQASMRAYHHLSVLLFLIHEWRTRREAQCSPASPPRQM